MLNEEWIVWKPDIDIPSLINLDNIEYGKNGLILNFSNNNEIIQIIFDSSVFSYKITDEGNLLTTFDYLNSNYPKEFLDNSLFKIKNSKYLLWFHNENYNIFEDFNIEHYFFKTHDDIVEVLSNYPPVIKVI